MIVGVLGCGEALAFIYRPVPVYVQPKRGFSAIISWHQWQSYCLWLGYRGQRMPQSIADSGSIILKQKIEAWARATEALGLTPVLKISRRLRAGVDDSQ